MNILKAFYSGTILFWRSIFSELCKIDGIAAVSLMCLMFILWLLTVSIAIIIPSGLFFFVFPESAITLLIPERFVELSISISLGTLSHFPAKLSVIVTIIAMILITNAAKEIRKVLR